MSFIKYSLLVFIVIFGACAFAQPLTPSRFAQLKGWINEGSGELCQALVTGNAVLNDGNRDIVCARYNLDYNRLKCATVSYAINQYTTQVLGGTAANFNCLNIKNELERVKVQWKAAAVDQKDNVAQAAAKAVFDSNHRIGLEDEMNQHVGLYKRVGGKFVPAPIHYGQVIAKTESQTFGRSVFEITLDGVGVGKAGAVDAHALSGTFHFTEANFEKDSIGIDAIIEAVTGPLTNNAALAADEMRLSVRAMKIFGDTVETYRQCNTRDYAANNIEIDDVLDDYNNWAIARRAVKMSKVIAAYNSAIAREAELSDFKLGDPQINYDYFNDDAAANLAAAGYEWYLMCGPRSDHNVQVNWGINLGKFGTGYHLSLFDPSVIPEPFNPFYKPLPIPLAQVGAQPHDQEFTQVAGNPASKNFVELCRAGSTAYINTNVNLRDNEQVIGLFTVICVIAHFKYELVVLPGITATADKNRYEELPKVNAGDLVRLLPPAIQAHLSALYNDDAATTATDFTAHYKTAFGGLNPIVHSTLNDLNLPNYWAAGANGFKRAMQTAFTKVFAKQICPLRYPGETALLYGTKVNFKANILAACDHKPIPKVAPCARTANGEVTFVLENRFDNNALSLSFNPASYHDLAHLAATDFVRPDPWVALATFQDP